MKINIKSSIFLGIGLILATDSSNLFAQTVNLNNRLASAAPFGSVAQWHTAATPSASTLVSNAAAVPVTSTPTNYWAYFFDGLGNCYSPGAKVTIVKTNCPGNNYNLSTLPGANAANLVWHTSTTPSIANRVTNPALASPGTYYAYFYDAVNNCYSPAGAPVIVDGSCSASLNTVSGTIYNDVDGLADNNIHTNATFTPNTGTNAAGVLYALLLDASNNVVATQLVASNGSYSFSNVPAGNNYKVMIGSNAGTVGNPAPVMLMPPGWELTGEKTGGGTGTDGVVPGVGKDGYSATFNVNANVSQVNFGVRLVPAPSDDCYTNNPYMPVNNGNFVVVNGITITPTARSGSVAEGYQGVFGCDNANTLTSYALWGGYDAVNPQAHAAANANTAWSITYTFSHPINDLKILVGSMGALGNENLIVTVDGMSAVITALESCYTTINGNEIIGGATAPYPNGAGNGVFVLSKSTPFTTLTFSGAGGYNGLNIEFCSSSILPASTGYSLSGTIFNDENGLTDGNVNGAAVGTTPSTTNIPGQLYANLLNSSNVVVATVPVSANGTYEFSNVGGGNYTVQLTTNQGVVNSPAPATVLMSGWNVTGEALGATGNDGNPNQLLNVTIVNSNVTNANFGIQRPPNSDNKSQTVAQPVGSVVPAGSITNNVSGLDEEDGTLGNANTIVIKSLPINSTMIYDGTPVTVGQIITGFNPALLSFTDITNTSTSTGFTYSFRDAAGQEDPSPATYTVNWGSPVSVTLLSFDAVKKGNIVALNWITVKETNNKGFDVERSNDSKNWTIIGFAATIAENGNSNSTLQYNLSDEQPLNGSNYYRLKQIDFDGGYDYSEVVKVNFNTQKTITTLHPNPAKDYITISHLKGGEEIKIVDIVGNILITQTANESTSRIAIKGLANGLYNCVINTTNGIEVHKFIINN